jgi:hypothetical protein
MAFLKQKSYDHFLFLKSRNVTSTIFSAKIFLNHNIGPRTGVDLPIPGNISLMASKINVESMQLK